MVRANSPPVNRGRGDAPTPIRRAAIEALSNGVCVVPPTEDGEKRPGVGEWAHFQECRSTLDDLHRWYGVNGKPGRQGMGAVCGKVSGNLEAFEFDARGECYEAFKDAGRALGHGDLIDRLEAGYSEKTPSGGHHWLYRCEVIAGNTPLARHESDEVNPKTGRPIIKPLIETRGEGGYIVTAPSSGPVHPTGRPYVLVSGGFGSIPTITREERQFLWDLARTFDRMPEPETPPPVTPKQAAAQWDDCPTPWDDYDTRTGWPEVLPDWPVVYRRGDTLYLRRPGKDRGVSATLNRNESNRLYVFSTSTEFEAGRPYSKFDIFALRRHGGDLKAATRALSRDGYGRFKTWVKVDGKWVLETRRNPCPRGVRIAKQGEGPPVEVDGWGAAGGNGHAGANGEPPRGEPEDEYAAATDEELGITDGDDVELENPRWLWERRFLRGKINLIAGEGGDGKTTVAILIGSVVIQGGAFPDGKTLDAPGLVMILAAEDGAGDTIKPRFIAAGADLSTRRLKILTASVNIPKRGDRPAMVHPVSLKDLAYWRAVFKRYRPALLIIDPLPPYLGRGVNDNKNMDVQQSMTEFGKLAGEFGVCVIAITHTGKATDRKLMHRILGSIAYRNVCRAVHFTLHDPDDPDVRYLHRDKCNLDEPVDALAYKLVSAEFERDGTTYKTCRVVFEPEPVAIDAEAMANPKRADGPTRGPDPKKESAAAAWLFDFLDGRAGWTERRDVIAAAGAAGLIGRQHKVTQKWSNLTMLYRAKKRVQTLDAPRAGKWVDEQDMATEHDRYPRICWRLTAEGTAF